MDHFTGDAAMTPFLHVPWWHIKWVSLKIHFLRGQASVHCITSSPKNMKHFLPTRVRQPSVVLSTVYTVGIVASASILLTQNSWLGRPTVELNLWFVLIFCLRSYPLFNYPFLLKDLEDHENSPLHPTTTRPGSIHICVQVSMCISWHQDVDLTAII